MRTATPARRLTPLLLLLGLGAASGLPAQVLPPHPPLRVLVVSDEVNPHGLSDEDLTQPGEISAALLATSALGLDDGAPDPVLEIPTDQIEDATSRLALPRGDPGAYDVLIYFAHRIPNGVDGAARQEAFVAAVEAFLEAGGGVLCFHHGIYESAGKESMLDLLGGSANGAVPWDTVDGQNVIDVAPGSFVTTNGIVYPDTVAYGDPGHGIPSAVYDVFNNTPDERYPSLDLRPSAGEIAILFASDYDGGNHLLGYVESRPQWRGLVMVYQPGEYQPNALQPGNNFQVLLNGIVFLAGPLFADGFESGDLSRWTLDAGGTP